MRHRIGSLALILVLLTLVEGLWGQACLLQLIVDEHLLLPLSKSVSLSHLCWRAPLDVVALDVLFATLSHYDDADLSPLNSE